MRTIKRYANRRLYDSESSKTITLDDIAELIKSQQEFQVIDNSSNEDITNKILAQTFLKINLNGVDDSLNKYLLSTLIRESSENMQHFLQKMILSGIGLANQTKDYIEQIIQSITQDKQLETNIISDLTQYVSQQAENLSTQVQNSIKSLGINWPHQEETELLEKLKNAENKAEMLEKQISELKQTLKEKEQQIIELSGPAGSVNPQPSNSMNA